ncbi:hypothetical protein K470DRAFT_239480 [Piedraia hortae CBS 480.64]|uniref:Uncharacterized protein n=1 Tax=Piedraia hortae CBS 480.64 TaxID=1314780 RepID=A0A6A7CAA5_9PEZI|nr:hypothetical protein K470DRAFT_239480 [Piedraia hortae CBS 480.64]
MFAPAHKPTRGRQTVLARRISLDKRKQKRDASDESDSASNESRDEATRQPPSPDPRVHSVSITDPFYVAGVSREEWVVSAAAPSEKPQDKPVEEEFLDLNPPLLPPRLGIEHRGQAVLKRNHADKLMTILHICMLRQDWHRAFRAWALLLRLEIGGTGMDVREYGHWGIGAELLIRTNEKEGFRQAQEYYNRFITRYPHAIARKYLVSAVAFYPALFNMWISGAQRQFSVDEHELGHKLQTALEIAARMDEVMESPAYNKSLPLLKLRGMVGLWISDLYIATASGEGDEGGDAEDNLERSRTERAKVIEVFGKLKSAGGELSESVLDLIETGGNDNEDDESSGGMYD